MAGEECKEGMIGAITCLCGACENGHVFVCRSVRFLQLHPARTPPIVTLGPLLAAAWRAAVLQCTQQRCAAVQCAAVYNCAMVGICIVLPLQLWTMQHGVLTHVTLDNSAGMDQEAMRTGLSMQEEVLKPGPTTNCQ